MMRSCANPNQAFVEQLKNWEVSTMRMKLRQEIMEQKHQWDHIHERDRISFLEAPLSIPQSQTNRSQWWENQNDEDEDDAEDENDKKRAAGNGDGEEE
jgi:hypothetical protein